MNDSRWLQDIDNNIRIIDGGMNKIRRLYTYIHTLLSRHFDIIIDTNTKTLKLDYLIRRLTFNNYKILSWLHFSIHHVNSIDIKNLKYADFHLAISSGINRQLQEITPNIPTKLIYNPIKPNMKNITLKTEGSLNLVYIGRVEWEHQKNLKLLFGALSTLPFDSYQLHLYGDGKDLEYCKKQAQYYQLNIKFYGWIQNPWEVITYPVDYLILSSNFEGFPMIIGESLSRGLPVISTNCSTGPADMIINGRNGYLYSTGDIEELSNLLHQLLKRDKTWNSTELKQSIHLFYADIYFDNILNILKEI